MILSAFAPPGFAPPEGATAAAANEMDRRRGEGAATDVARRLAANHYREVWSVLRRLGVYDGLEDATQHVFLVAASRRASIRVESERAYVISVAVRTAA